MNEEERSRPKARRPELPVQAEPTTSQFDFFDGAVGVRETAPNLPEGFLGRMYKCLSVSIENIMMILLDRLRDVVVYRFEFIINAAYSRFYIPLTDANEAERLEKIFRSYEGNQIT